MNTLQEIANLNIDKIQIVLKKAANGTITVLVPVIAENVEDQAVKNLMPFSFSDTPENIDKRLINDLSKPLEETQKFISNVREAEAHRAEQSKKTQAEKIKNDNISTAEKALKKIIDKPEYDATKDKNKVVKAIKVIQELDPENKYVKKIKATSLKTATQSLF